MKKKLTEEHPEYYPDVLEPEKPEIDVEACLAQLDLRPEKGDLAKLKQIQQARHDSELD